MSIETKKKISWCFFLSKLKSKIKLRLKLNSVCVRDIKICLDENADNFYFTNFLFYEF